ncbi:predicted protein [Nematostella vectensis]|uniref:ShKT domain-containing protein n=1 Tax=Nematostella vectensis TaxID=45351 RepID=A7SQK7_NEMVE|nr:predicted protein [Nematostella vectensis]|eukprot:XP_001626105.1 predicted protein [Nematostella vectensis]
MNRALVPSPLPTEEGILNFLLFSILQYFKSRFYHGTRLEAAHLKIRDFTRRHPIIAQLAFLAALPVTIIGSSVLCFCAIVGSICFGILSCIALFWICAALLLASPFLAPCACITTIAAMLYLVLNFIVHDVIYGLRLRPPRLHQGVWTFITDLRHIVTTIARYLIGLINQLYSDPWTSLTHLFIAKAPRRVQLLFGWVFRFVPGDSYIWTRPRANMFGEYSESQASVLTSQIIGVNRRGEKPQRRQASVKSFLSYYAAQLMPNQWQENATALKQDILDMFLWHTPRLIPQRWVTRVVFLPMWVPRLFVRSFCACVDGTFRRAFAYVWSFPPNLRVFASYFRLQNPVPFVVPRVSRKGFRDPLVVATLLFVWSREISPDLGGATCGNLVLRTIGKDSELRLRRVANKLEEGSCRDQYRTCPGWGASGYCDKPFYKSFMKLMCAYTCDTCDVIEEPKPRKDESLTTSALGEDDKTTNQEGAPVLSSQSEQSTSGEKQNSQSQVQGESTNDNEENERNDNGSQSGEEATEQEKAKSGMAKWQDNHHIVGNKSVKRRTAETRGSFHYTPSPYFFRTLRFRCALVL